MSAQQVPVDRSRYHKAGCYLSRKNDKTLTSVVGELELRGMIVLPTMIYGSSHSACRGQRGFRIFSVCSSCVDAKSDRELRSVRPFSFLELSLQGSFRLRQSGITIECIPCLSLCERQTRNTKEGEFHAAAGEKIFQSTGKRKS